VQLHHFGEIGGQPIGIALAGLSESWTFDAIHYYAPSAHGQLDRSDRWHGQPKRLRQCKGGGFTKCGRLRRWRPVELGNEISELKDLGYLSRTK
jgi:hypothetical protein